MDVVQKIIFTCKQWLLNIDMNTKVVQHVPRIKLENFQKFITTSPSSPCPCDIRVNRAGSQLKIEELSSTHYHHPHPILHLLCYKYYFWVYCSIVLLFLCSCEFWQQCYYRLSQMENKTSLSLWLSDYLASSIDYLSLMFIGLSWMTDCHFDFLFFSWIRTTWQIVHYKAEFGYQALVPCVE